MATNGFSLRRVIADTLAITVSFLALAALDAWIRAGFAFVPTAPPWQQFGYGLAFTPFVAIVAFGPAALVVEVLGTTRRQAFIASLILGLGAGAVLQWVTGDPRSFLLLWGTGLLGGIAIQAWRPRTARDIRER